MSDQEIITAVAVAAKFYLLFEACRFAYAMSKLAENIKEWGVKHGICKTLVALRITDELGTALAGGQVMNLKPVCIIIGAAAASLGYRLGVGPSMACTGVGILTAYNVWGGAHAYFLVTKNYRYAESRFNISFLRLHLGLPA